MFQHDGFWLPEGEQHWVTSGLEDYQSAGREAAYRYVRNWEVAIDVGANIGIFSRAFAKKFRNVVAFEPIPEVRECLERNVPENVMVMPYAVSDCPGELIMRQLVKTSGGSFIANHPEVAVPSGTQLKGRRAIPVEVRTMDGFGFEQVGLVKMDIQGAEHLALRGGKETIARCRPVILIEEKPRNGPLDDENCRRASAFLISLGMTPREKCGPDRVYVFDT